MKESNLSVLLGAAFLMATSAIGPGFLTQTTVFTSQLKGALALSSSSLSSSMRLPSSMCGASSPFQKPGQDIANAVLPGLGYFVSALVVAGGLAFNIGNIGGAGLGMNVLLGFPLLLVLSSVRLLPFYFP